MPTGSRCSSTKARNPSKSGRAPPPACPPPRCFPPPPPHSGVSAAFDFPASRIRNPPPNVRLPRRSRRRVPVVFPHLRVRDRRVRRELSQCRHLPRAEGGIDRHARLALRLRPADQVA